MHRSIFPKLSVVEAVRLSGWLPIDAAILNVIVRNPAIDETRSFEPASFFCPWTEEKMGEYTVVEVPGLTTIVPMNASRCDRKRCEPFTRGSSYVRLESRTVALALFVIVMPTMVSLNFSGVAEPLGSQVPRIVSMLESKDGLLPALPSS